jgi:hypothetical protein
MRRQLISKRNVKRRSEQNPFAVRLAVERPFGQEFDPLYRAVPAYCNSSMIDFHLGQRLL